VLRKRYQKPGDDPGADLDERDMDESDPRRRKRRWL
jgi:hypothetical protein